jgi:hypothetical protein
VCNGDEIGLDFKLDWILVKTMEWNVLKISRNMSQDQRRGSIKNKK